MPEFVSPFSGNKLNRKLNKDELLRALRFSLAAEYEAAQIYTQIAEATTDKKTAQVLTDIANEELIHVGEFLALIKKINPEEEKFYQEGENEVLNMTKEAKQYILAVRSFIINKTVNEIDKIAHESKNPDPHITSILNQLSNHIKKTYQWSKD